jgi:hypothetical protein
MHRRSGPLCEYEQGQTHHGGNERACPRTAAPAYLPKRAGALTPSGASLSSAR